MNNHKVLLTNVSLLILVLGCFFSSCKDTPAGSRDITESKVDSISTDEPVAVVETKPAISYQWLHRKTFFKEYGDSLSEATLTIITDVNRMDLIHLKRQDSILVPTPMDLARFDYSPFPSSLDAVKGINKIIFFAYLEEYFGAYENGKLVLTGPTNMGKSSSRTPRGLFFTNWKSKESISTVSSEWILKWNFNISNFAGVGFHEYALPGYPASHSCLRLKAEDAIFFYEWANQWKLDKSDKILAKGTPVIVFGMYPFGKPKPWLALVKDSSILIIPVTKLDSLVAEHSPVILKEQNNRSDLENRTSSS